MAVEARPEKQVYTHALNIFPNVDIESACVLLILIGPAVS